MPGIIVQSIAFGGFVTALGLSEDVQKGLIDRFRSLPMSRAAVLTGRTFSDILLNCLSLVVLLAVGFLAGFNFIDSSAGEIVLGIVLLLLLGYAFSWVFALVGLFSSSPETANSIGFTLIFPLTFASSVFVPVGTMPDGLRQFAEANPFTTVGGRGPRAVDRHAAAHRRVDGVRLVRRADRDLRAAGGRAVPARGRDLVALLGRLVSRRNGRGTCGRTWAGAGRDVRQPASRPDGQRHRRRPVRAGTAGRCR